MKELIFEGKRLDNGEMVYGASILQLTDDEVYMPQSGEGCFYEVNEDENLVRILETTMYRVDPETVRLVPEEETP